jgi:outer membrane receptor protein involved in Fe transport
MTHKTNAGRVLARCAPALLGIALLAPAAWAQSTTDGAIGGAVTDPSKAVIPGATVTARNQATNATAAAQTDGNGRYIVIHLRPGIYDLEAASKGFTPAKQTGVVVEIGRVTPIDLALAVAGGVESVTVTAEAPVINTEQQDFSTNLNQTSINNLPINGRRWFNFALATPGAVTDGGFGDVSFRGISGLLNNNTVDGGDNNQAFFSEEKGRTRIAYSTSQQSIQEFQVDTASYSAEYGRAAGGVVNAVTKSGANAFHGGLFYYNRDQSFGAFVPFATQPALVNGSYIQVPVKPLDIRQQFGGDFGGYLIKNKLFFYFNNDDQVRHFPAVATPSNPTALFGALSSSEMSTLTTRLGAGTLANLTSAQITQGSNQVLALIASLSGTAPRTGNQELWFPKIDWKPTENNTVTFSYNRLRWKSPYGVQTNTVVARGLDGFGDDFVKDDTGVARWVSIVSPTVTNEFRFQYSRDFEYEYANPALPGEPLNTNGYATETSISGASSFDFGQPYYTNRYAYPTEKRTQFADTATWSRGKHLVKFGVDVNHVGDAIDYLNTGGGEYYYNNRVDFISDFIASQTPAVRAATAGMVCGTAAKPLQCYNEYQQGFGPLGFNFTTMEYAGFVQDQWRATPRLTVNLGLRYEFEKLPPAQIPNTLFPATGVLNSDKHDFGPRVGFAWDVSGQGKTSVRGGYGVYYGRIMNGTIFNAIANTGVSNAQVSATIYPSTNGNVGPIYNTVLTSLLGTVAKPSIIYFPGDLRNPMIQEYDLVVEHEIAPNTMVSLSWIGSLGHFLPEAVDTNLPAPTTNVYQISGGSLNGDSVTVPFYKGTRPNTNFNQMTMVMSRVSSSYNAAVVQFNRRLTKGVQFQTSYTLASSKDNQTSISPTPTGNAPLSPFDLSLDRSPSTFDQRHKVVGSIVWQPPYFDHASPAAHALLSGWTIAPMFTCATGLPFSPTVSGNPPSGSGNAGSGVIGATGSSRVPFLERDSFRYPGLDNLDLHVSRAFYLSGERVKMELIGESFNILNHVNYTGIVAQMYTLGGTAAAPVLTYFPTFGTLNAASNNNVLSSRQIQIGARVTF